MTLPLLSLFLAPAANTVLPLPPAPRCHQAAATAAAAALSPTLVPQLTPRCRQGQARHCHHCRCHRATCRRQAAATLLSPSSHRRAAAALLPRYHRPHRLLLRCCCHHHAAAATNTALPLPPTLRCCQNAATAAFVFILVVVAVIIANSITERPEDGQDELLGIGYWRPWRNDKSGNNLEYNKKIDLDRGLFNLDWLAGQPTQIRPQKNKKEAM